MEEAVRRTLKFKLLPLGEEDAELLSYLVEEYSKVVGKLLLCARYSRLYLNPSRTRLHNLTYRRLRGETNLHSNHVTSARDLVVEMVKASSHHKVFPEPDGLLPVRLFRGKTYFITDDRVKIVITPGTHAFCKLMGDESWLNMLSLARGAELIKEGDEFYLHVVLERRIEFREPEYVVGVDTNLDNLTLACLRASDGSVVSTYRVSLLKIHGRRIYLRNVRRLMQSNGRRFDRERKAIKQEVEKVVNEVYKFVKSYNCTVAVESLGRIRDKLLKRAKRSERRYLYSAFLYRRLLMRIKEKLEWHGIKVAEVGARFTSRRCSVCGATGVRDGRIFRCPKCGVTMDADLNAARNIALSIRQNAAPRPKGRGF